MTTSPGKATALGALDVHASGHPERPIAVRLVEDGPTELLSRTDAWRLWHLLQAELVRTLPNPPTYPQATPR